MVHAMVFSTPATIWQTNALKIKAIRNFTHYFKTFTTLCQINFCSRLSSQQFECFFNIHWKLCFHRYLNDISLMKICPPYIQNDHVYNVQHFLPTILPGHSCRVCTDSSPRLSLNWREPQQTHRHFKWLAVCVVIITNSLCLGIYFECYPSVVL